MSKYGRHKKRGMKVDKSLQYEQQLQAEHEQFELMKVDLEYADFRKNRDDYNAICRTVEALDTYNKLLVDVTTLPLRRY